MQYFYYILRYLASKSFGTFFVLIKKCLELLDCTFDVKLNYLPYSSFQCPEEGDENFYELNKINIL